MTKTELGRMLEKRVNGWLKAAGWTTKLVEPKKLFVPDKKRKMARAGKGPGQVSGYRRIRISGGRTSLLLRARL